MTGRTASFFAVEVDADAEVSPCCRCESGTLIGLCRRIARFFCVLPILRFDFEPWLSFCYDQTMTNIRMNWSNGGLSRKLWRILSYYYYCLCQIMIERFEVSTCQALRWSSTHLIDTRSEVLR